MSDYTEVEREFSWDDEVSNEGSPFRILPEGEYSFTVESFERGRSKGSAKLPPCNMAIVNICIYTDDGGHVRLSDNILLHSKVEWKISQFFIALGMKKHGEPLKMNWPGTVGKSGRCKVGIRKWKGNDGSERESNEITGYLDPVEAPAAEENKYW